MTAFVMRWHRRLSLLAGVALLLWASSGLLHPLMSWTNPQPAAFSPPVGEPLALPSRPLQDVLAEQGITAVGIVRLLRQGDALLWQVATPDRQRLTYLDTASGAPATAADRERAILLARHYTGLTEAPLREVEEITQFSRDYPAVNRLLPVWRVVFERGDALSAYVHTGEDRLGQLSDRRKRALLWLFQTVHTLDFLDGVEGLRLGLILAAVGSVVAMAMLGIGLLLRVRRRSGVQGARRAHRSLAWLVWAPVLMFSLSGLFHLLRLSPALLPEAPTVNAAVTVERLARPPAGFEGSRSLSLLPLADGSAVWRGRINPQDVRLADAVTGASLEGGDAALALRLAAPSSAIDPTFQKGFSSEYGFANKRLPVWRVEEGGGLAFVDVAYGLVAARARPLDVAEQWSFSTFHKWQFLDPLGRAWRDGFLVSGALLGLLAAAFGLALRRRH